MKRKSSCKVVSCQHAASGIWHSLHTLSANGSLSLSFSPLSVLADRPWKYKTKTGNTTEDCGAATLQKQDSSIKQASERVRKWTGER